MFHSNNPWMFYKRWIWSHLSALHQILPVATCGIETKWNSHDGIDTTAHIQWAAYHQKQHVNSCKLERTDRLLVWHMGQTSSFNWTV